MEMAVLKETCRDRFDAFIKSLDLLPLKGENLVHRIQAIKLLQLLKGRPNYRAIMEQETMEDLNNLLDTDSLI